MDYSTVGSETIESLNFLRPQVTRAINRNCKNKQLSTITTVSQNIARLEKLRKDILKHDNFLRVVEPITTSRSSIAKKTVETKELVSHSIISCASFLNPAYRKDYNRKIIGKDKPVIKVTVIPKTQQTQIGRLHRKPRHVNRIQRTASNQENSIKSEKLFLVVAGTKEKIYEIKPSESAQFSYDHTDLLDEKNVVKNINNIKELIKSLDMDKKKRKRKNNYNTNTLESNKLNEDAINGFQSCKCPQSSWLDIENTNTRPSRIRIFGRVGFTEDEKYVLNCSATVDKEPIITISDSAENCSPQFFGRSNYDKPMVDDYKTYGSINGPKKLNNSKEQKDVNIQVDFENDHYNNKYRISNNFQSKESQGTQVDFNIQLPNLETLKDKDKDQMNQCNCKNNSNLITNFNKQLGENKLREYQSPLVIISVYPKQDALETERKLKKPKDTRRTPFSGKVYDGLKKSEKKHIKNMDSNKDSPKSSRIPSPIKNYYNSGKKDNNQIATRIIQTTKINENANRQSNSMPNKIIRNRSNFKHQNKSYDNSTSVYVSQNEERINCIPNKKEPKNMQAQLKKTLVEDYTKMLTEKMNDNVGGNDFKNVKSNVQINNVSDNNLSFNQSKIKNDLHIRKLVKEAGTQKNEENNHSNRKSTKLAFKTEPKRRNFSPQTNDVPDLNNHNTSTLNPRDSIEIFHRRETTLRKDTGIHQSAKENYYLDNDINLFAPIKHYKGDDCELRNPVERDKQIRGLLGIDKEKPNTSQQEHKFGSVIADHSVIECLYKKTGNKNSEAGISLYNVCSSCHFDKRKQHNGNICEYENTCCQKNTGFEKSAGKTSLYQQLILNRNIQVFLQVEQFSKQKPIILSRKQYNKVKKTIQKTISKKVGQVNRKNSIISIGEVRKRTKPNIRVDCKCPKHTQTKRSAEICNTSKDNKKNNGKKITCSGSCLEQRQVQTIVLFDSKKTGQSETDKKDMSLGPEREMVSSLEIRYTNVAYVKRATFSSTIVESLSSSSFNRRNNSLYTLFKGNRKSPTPNLGTSAFSLLSNEDKSESKTLENSMSSPEIKAKKPFLRRLMSCLVMQSRVSDKKCLKKHGPKVSDSVNSSVDSYHINTSLGAIEMSSSLFDTSDSFFSSHTICPVINNKMKRGFFSSVRGFLTTRRS